MQRQMPFDVKARELVLPLDAGKIITVPGVRRCGKSSLLAVTVNRLIEMGIDRRRILWIGFDDERLADIGTDKLNDILIAYMEMYPEIELKDTYMFFDEIQLVEHWELFVMRVYKSYCKNVYLSGSNAQMLSSQLATTLRGWPLEYKEYPLSFREYLMFKEIDVDSWSEQGKAKLRNAFLSYNREGGFPDPTLATEESVRQRELQGYFNTMLFRDMMEHYGLSNAAVVRYFLKRVMANLSKPSSINNIYNEIKSQGGKASKDRLYQILDYAQEVFLLFKVPKYERSLVKENSGLSKYYVIDNGLRQSVLIPQSGDEGKLLENTVFLQLHRMAQPDSKISYYKNGSECDFVVQNGERVESLYQVTWQLNDADKEREINGLLAASEATGCMDLNIITYDQSSTINIGDNTIRVIPAWKWLLGQ